MKLELALYQNRGCGLATVGKKTLCHPQCQAAGNGHYLQEQVVDFREGYMADPEKLDHILYHCCLSKAPSEKNAGK